MKIVLVANTAWYIANFRLNLAHAFKASGYEVIAIAPPDENAERIEAAGIRFLPMPMDNNGTNPIKDIGFFFRLFKALRKEQPGVYLGYTVKPNVYGGLACQLLRISSIHNIAGLGTVFIQDTWLTKFVCNLYRLGLRKAAKVYFQNQDDLDLFLGHGLVSTAQAERLPGSGVDTRWFAPFSLNSKKSTPPLTTGRNNSFNADDHDRKTENKLTSAPFRFLLSARLLWDKGIGEYVEAARQLLAQGKQVECLLLGFIGAKNPANISRETVTNWHLEGVIRYLGNTHDVRPIIAQVDCAVLPSYYREGVPRSLLEAASMGKPVITTDAVGCRDVVDDGITGLLCRPKDVQDLIDKMDRMLALSPQERIAMGFKGREKMCREFDEQIVISRYLHAVNEIKVGN